jgi:hypothetical protein
MSTFTTIPAPKDPEPVDFACGDDDDGSGHDYPCPVCGGPCYALGGLGNLMHFRCQDCGSDSHTEMGR